MPSLSRTLSTSSANIPTPSSSSRSNPVKQRQRRQNDADLESQPSKRPRLSQTSVLTDLDPDEQDDSQTQLHIHDSPGPPDETLLERSHDGYLPGSVCRVALYRFLTYEYAEFKPGPHLNMIIGPNGTGKSTIVCAIALGLGWSPTVLGRAKHVADFVKQGHTQAWIELELQGLPGQSNITIKRTLSSSDNTSEFYLNSTKCGKRDIQEKVAEFNIDVGNLCTFLPQDKVAEFARMTPAQLLSETQKAAGDAKLFKWHEKLKSYGHDLVQVTRKLQEKTEECTNLESRNEALEVDVQRFRDRQQIENRIQHLKVIIPVAEYREVAAQFEQLKQQRDQLKADLVQAKKNGEPIQAKTDEYADKKDKVDLQIERLRENQKRDQKALHKVMQENETVSSEIENLHNEMKELRRTEDSRKARIKELRTKIQQLEDAISQEPEEQDLSELNQQLRSVKEELRECHMDKQKIQDEKNDISIESRTHVASKNEVQHKLANLQNVRAQRLEHIRNADVDVYKAILWLRENQSLFTKPVFEPILVEINVKERKFVDATESCIPWPVMKTFVCQTRSDYDLFTRELMDKQKLRLTVAEVEGMNRDDFQPPIPHERLGQFGFEKYILDVIEGPSDILTYLCHTCHLHTIPVSSDSSSNVEAIEESKKFKRFILGSTNFTVTFSRYGNKLPITASKDIRPARSLASSLDRALKERLELQMQDIHDAISNLESRMGVLMKKEKEHDKTILQLDNRLNELKREKHGKQEVRARWEKAKVDLSSRKRLLAQEENRPTMEAQRSVLQKKIRKLTLARVKLAREYAENIVERQRTQANLEVAMNTRDYYEKYTIKLRRMEREFVESLKEAQEAYEMASEKAAEVRSEARSLKDIAQNLYNDLEEAKRGEVDELMQSGEIPTLVDLRASLAVETAAYEMARGVRSGVIEQYMLRQKEIDKLREKVQEFTETQQRFETKIQQHKDKWLPALQSLVGRVSERFSSAFERLGCAGQVVVSEDEDFSKWGIDILVRFRDNEPLQPLTAQRQSGGERSLSTIMYLMSLTELSRSPFSLVDEINQGMDQRSERNVHNHIVNVTCHSRASQYFLITPKLLTDLKYHEMMRVLVINNGEFAPSSFKCSDYIHRRLAQHQEGSQISSLANGTNQNGGLLNHSTIAA